MFHPSPNWAPQSQQWYHHPLSQGSSLSRLSSPYNFIILYHMVHPYPNWAPQSQQWYHYLLSQGSSLSRLSSPIVISLSFITWLITFKIELPYCNIIILYHMVQPSPPSSLSFPIVISLSFITWFSPLPSELLFNWCCQQRHAAIYALILNLISTSLYI